MPDGEKILQLLQSFGDSGQLIDSVQAIYNTAYRQRYVSPAKAIKSCQQGLRVFDRSLPTAFENPVAFAYARGQFHLLIASIYLDRGEIGDWKRAEGHYRQGAEEVHSNAWVYLDSLACLGLAIAQQKLSNLVGAIDACHQADMFATYESIPSEIDMEPLRQAIAAENSTLITILEQTEVPLLDLVWQIPIASNIVAGLEYPIAKDYIRGYVEIEERESKAADYFIVVVDGNSMAGDNILSGDKVLIRQQAEVANGDIAAIVINTPDIKSLAVLKRYYVDERAGKQHWFLRSSNVSAKNLVIVPPHTDTAEIRQMYDKEIQADKVNLYENAELKIVGIYVKLISKERKSLIEKSQGRGVSLSEARIFSKLEKLQEDLISEIQHIQFAGVEVLDNFEGFVLIQIIDNRGDIVPFLEQKSCTLSEKETYQLRVTIQSGKPAEIEDNFSIILLTDGEDNEAVVFTVSLDCDSLRFEPDEFNVTVANEYSKSATKISRIMAERGEHTLFVHIAQKNELIQVIPIELEVYSTSETVR